MSAVDLSSEATATAVDRHQTTPDGPSGDPSFCGTVSVLAIPTLAFLVYSLLYQFTKPTMVSAASGSELISILAYTALAWVGLTVGCGVIAFALDGLGSRIAVAWARPVGTVFVGSALYSVFILVFAENFVYTATGWGLRSDNSVLPKVAFGLLSVSLGVLVGRRMSRLYRRTTTFIAISLAVVGVAASSALLPQWSKDSFQVVTHRLAEARPFNVIILSSDGVEAKHMSVYGYERRTTPFLDRHSSEFRIFENAFSNNGRTTGSITSLLTGRSPLRSGVVFPPDALAARDARRTLPSILGTVGYYRSNWSVRYYADATDQNLVGSFDKDNGRDLSQSLLHQLPLGTGPARWFLIETLSGVSVIAKDVLGIEELANPYGQVTNSIAYGLSDHDRLNSVKSEIRAHDRFFINVHFVGTHGPDFHLADPHFSRNEQQTRPWQRDFYDDSIRQFDNYVQQIYHQLERSAKLSGTLLIVTSDHGKRWRTNRRVPLLIRFPQMKYAGTSSANVQRMDVAPTVLDVLGFRKPSWMQGVRLTGSTPEDRQLISVELNEAEITSGRFYAGDRNLTIVAIRCQNWVRLLPNGATERGRVSGSSSTCTDEPRLASLR